MCVTIQLGDYIVTIYKENPLVLYPIEKIKKYVYPYLMVSIILNLRGIYD
jgi:hypothetical protein